MGIIHEVFSVYSASPRRHSVLDLHLGCNLGSPCQTRCIEQHDSVLQFKWDLPAITKALEEISEWREDIYSSQASILIKIYCNSVELVWYHQYNVAIFKYLQNKNTEVDTVKCNLKFLEDTVMDSRNNGN